MPFETAVDITTETHLRDPRHCGRGFVRRLVGRTVAQQLAPAIEVHCTCGAGSENADQPSTLLSIDGIGAFDLVSRQLSFVLQFCGSPSLYFWEDDSGVVHTVTHRRKEQGDPLMPDLFSVGQYPALAAISRR